MPRSDRHRSLVSRIAGAFFAIALLPGIASAAVPTLEGFGATTRGGSGKTIVHVTNLNDSGPGSLRGALSKGNRYVVFDVAGIVYLTSPLSVKGSNVTVDGLSAPAPGVTIRQAGLLLAGVHDVVISGLRIRAPGMYSTEGDGITIRDGTYNVVIDHVSANNCTDGNIDITNSSHDITVQWSLLSNCAKNMLINYQAQHVTLHHNIWVNSQWRNPNVQYSDGSPTVAPDTTADFRNNIVWNWGDSGSGTILQCGAKANVVHNFYYSGATTTAGKNNAIVNGGCPASASYPGPTFYTMGNVSGDGTANVNIGNAATAFPRATVATQDACTAANRVLSGAGVSPRDTLDQSLVSGISLATCTSTATAPTLTLSASPSSVASGAASTLSWTSTNTGSCTASGAWSGSRASSGSATVNPTATSTYTLACTGLAGTVTQSTTVTVASSPTLSISASPASIASGQSASLSWSTTHATACTASGAWSGSKATSGMVSVAPTQTSTYGLTCTGSAGSASASTSVTVTAAAPTVSLGASPTSVSAGQSSTLSWSSTNASGCTASGGWSGTMSTSGSASVAPGSTTTYGLACTGPGGTASTSSTISVAAPSGGTGYSGFGASTPGGYGQPVYHVTNLNDSGAGSLRDAVSQGNRYVVFDVAGTITLSTVVDIRGSYVTVNGLSAPSPGVTIKNAGLRIAYNNGTTPHDVIVSGLRVRTPAVNSTEGDGITIKDGVYNIVVDHVSIDGATDGNIDITKSAHDVTVQWSVLSNSTKSMLINYQAGHVSLHHNVWVDAQWRNPNIQYTDGSTAVAPDVTADFRNNLIWNWGDNGGGTILQCGAKANVVNNFYFSGATTAYRQANAIVNEGCPASSSYPGPSFFTAGNFSADNLSFDINTKGNMVSPFSAAAVDTQDACSAARDALAGAGVAPRDTVDQQHLGAISLPACSVP